MKKVLTIALCLCFLYSFSGYVSAQQRTQNSIQIDSAGTKQQAPLKQTRRQKARVKKTENNKTKLDDLKLRQDDRPLLMKEKDTLQKKAQ
jgi:hypothetical protein